MRPKTGKFTLNYANAKGFVLVTVLLFVFILSLLALTLSQVSLMETKMSGYYQEKILSLVDAENKLIKDEGILATGQIPREAILITDTVCGVKFYRLTAAGKFGATKSVVQSTFVKIGDVSHCDPKPKIKAGRQSWKEL